MTRRILTPLHRRIAGESRLFAGLPPGMAERLLEIGRAHV